MNDGIKEETVRQLFQLRSRFLPQAEEKKEKEEAAAS